MIGSTPSQNDDSLSIASERGANAGSMRGASTEYVECARHGWSVAL